MLLLLLPPKLLLPLLPKLLLPLPLHQIRRTLWKLSASKSFDFDKSFKNLEN